MYNTYLPTVCIDFSRKMTTQLETVEQLITLYNKVRKTWVVTEEWMSNEWWTTRALTGALTGP